MTLNQLSIRVERFLVCWYSVLNVQSLCLSLCLCVGFEVAYAKIPSLYTLIEKCAFVVLVSESVLNASLPLGQYLRVCS